MNRNTLNPKTSTGRYSNMSQQNTMTYDLQAIMSLPHLPNTLLTISHVTGGPIPQDKQQLYINTLYRVPPERRKDEKDVGIRRTSGFNIQLEEIDDICRTLQDLKKEIQEKTSRHYFVCEYCTQNNNEITFHQKRTADKKDEICPKKQVANQPDNSQKPGFRVE